MRKVKFAVVGIGHIGKRHADMILNNGHSELVAVADSDHAKASIIDVPFYDHLDDLLKENSEVEVVNICTPNGLHAEHGLNALRHAKHIVCEKPMALNSSDCHEMINAAREKEKKIFSVVQNRYSPPAKLLKNIKDQNILGEIYYVKVDCFWNRGDNYYKQSPWRGTLNLDGGPLFTQFSHFIDLLRWILGDLSILHAHFTNNNHCHTTEFEDTGVVSFKLENGALGSLNYSTSVYDQNMESSITIIGEHGTIKIGGQYMDRISYCHIKKL